MRSHVQLHQPSFQPRPTIGGSRTWHGTGCLSVKPRSVGSIAMGAWLEADCWRYSRGSTWTCSLLTSVVREGGRGPADLHGTAARTTVSQDAVPRIALRMWRTNHPVQARPREVRAARTPARGHVLGERVFHEVPGASIPYRRKRARAERRFGRCRGGVRGLETCPAHAHGERLGAAAVPAPERSSAA